MIRWYSFVMYQERFLQPPFMGVMVGATTEEHPKLPPGAQMLGHVRNTRAQAVEEAIDYLQIERGIQELDVLYGRAAEMRKGAK